ncbi:MAG TPA: TMEM175 family protein [Steroidobacteraceae bacterium]|nr:TMEM175 family protein [Steroidobacteraceae bacterium]
MGKNRLEAFSDGVIAILITIMVLELKVPHGEGWDALQSLLPVFLTYLLSFVILAIYWNNHHHLLHAVQQINGSVLWANMHLLFWLSLVPFVTGWMEENHFTRLPVASYGTVLIGAACAYYILVRTLVRQQSKNAALAAAIGNDFKGKISIAIYAIGIALAFVHTMLSCAAYALVSVIWLIPDRRIEKSIH